MAIILISADKIHDRVDLNSSGKLLFQNEKKNRCVDKQFIEPNNLKDYVYQWRTFVYDEIHISSLFFHVT